MHHTNRRTHHIIHILKESASMQNKNENYVAQEKNSQKRSWKKIYSMKIDG